MSSTIPAPAAGAKPIPPARPALAPLASPPALPFAHLLKVARPHPPLLPTSGSPASPLRGARAPEVPAAGRARDREPDEAARPVKDRTEPLDPLDPATRQAAQLAPPSAVISPSNATSEEIAPRARVSMEELLPQLVKRIAWAGDRRRGSVQMELGAGRHAGTTITIHADDGRVRVEVQGNHVDDLRERINRRLRTRGLDVASVE